MPEKISLKSREFIPKEKINIQTYSALNSNKKTHVLMQFANTPSKKEKEQLKEIGIQLLNYVPDKTWFASIQNKNLPYLLLNQNIIFIGNILPEDKISPNIRKYGIGTWCDNKDGTANLTVSFFLDVPESEIKQVIEKYGTGYHDKDNTRIIRIQKNSVMSLANEDIVQWIENLPPPLTRFNDGSREVIGVNTVQASPYDLNGTGVVLAEWDGGHANHSDYNSRTIVGDPPESADSHATHVAGTMLGDGNLSEARGGAASQYRGMAPNATLITYKWPNTLNELYTKTNDSIANYGAVLSQNSWGYDISVVGCEYLGYYDSLSHSYDNITKGLSIDGMITVVFAVGNERNKAYCDIPSNPYNTTPGGGQVAKNTITVGAVAKDESMSSFSSWGPTDDGRIKPDVVAVGVSVTSTYTTDTYAPYSGTSMAAPAVSGTIALIYEDYRNTHYSNPLPSTVKALLAHTAKDLNETGPDYTTGWGLVNATAAIDKIREDVNKINIITEDNITSSGENKTYQIYVSGQAELKITLAWDDYPGTVGAAKTLVNDLDLVLLNSTGDRFYPWTLDPNNPSSPALQNSTDNINNIEQVYIQNPNSGFWNVIVNGTLVPQPDQSYSLISSNYSIPLYLYQEIYGLNITAINRGESWKAYAKWSEPVNFSFIEYNITNTLINITTENINNNWTNHTNTTGNDWVLGAHLIKFYVNNSAGIWNGTLPQKSFELWGWSEINESVIPHSINETVAALLLCGIRDSNTTTIIPNYNVTFYDNTTLIGSSLTNSTGWANISYEWNPGTYEVKCNITDSVTLFYNTSINSNTTTITVNDITPPNFSDLKNSSAVYGNEFQANITWADNVEISAVLFESNFTGNSLNYTASNQSDEYYFTVNAENHTVGDFVACKWYANDSVNNWNFSSHFNYTTSKAQSLVRLFLNETQANATYTSGDIINITADINITGKNIIIEANFSGSAEIIVNGTAPLYNLTNSSNIASGIYNITAYFAGDENYTASLQTYYFGLCPICQSAGSWSACSGSSQSRTVYTCNASANYTCQSSTETLSCSVASSSSPSSSSSSATITSTSTEKIIINRTNETTTAAISNFAAGRGILISVNNSIEYIEIESESNINSAEIKISYPKTISPPSPKDNVYMFIKIENQNLININKTSIKFFVNKTWTVENNINESTIALKRYNNGWQKLNTTKTGEDYEKLYFVSVFSGLSLFAVTGEQAIIEKHIETIVNETDNQTTNQTITEIQQEHLIDKKDYTILIVVIAIIILSATLLLLLRKKKNESFTNKNVPLDYAENEKEEY